MNGSNYGEKRRRFFSRVEDFWPDLYGEEYALYDVYFMDEAEIETIRQATERIGRIFFKTAELLRRVPDETFTEMGFPRETLSFLRLRILPVESVIARLDLVHAGDRVKCLEINADTPTFIKECFHVNALICREFGVRNPNEGMEGLLGQAVRWAVQASLRWLQERRPYIVFTAHGDHIEDRNTVLYLQQVSGLPSRFVPLHRLQIVRGQGLYDEAGNRIHVLYRQTFPIENLILDEDEAGHPIGLWLLELVETRKLAVVNPPSAFLLQNKAVQAVIWGLHQQDHPFFTVEEHQWIEEYFLPTYLDPDPFLQAGERHVKKPVFGREGDTVEVYDGTGRLILEDAQKSYDGYLPVYQQYVEQPVVRFQSEKGIQTGHMIVGSFLLRGKPGAIGCRVGSPIINNLSYYLPVGVKP